MLTACLSVVYLASVWWEPADAKEPVPQSYLRELGDVAAADSGPRRIPVEAGERTDAGGNHPLAGKGPFDLVVQLIDAASGEPVVAAEVHLYAAARPDSEPILNIAPSADGRAALARLEHAQYRVKVHAEGYLEAPDLFIELPADGREFEVELEPGAMVAGWVRSPAGDPVAGGLVRLRHVGTGTSHDLRPGSGGSFRSAAVESGLWDIFWLEHAHKTPDPRLSHQARLEPGQTLSLTMTVPRGGAGSNQVAIVRN